MLDLRLGEERAEALIDLAQRAPSGPGLPPVPSQGWLGFPLGRARLYGARAARRLSWSPRPSALRREALAAGRRPEPEESALLAWLLEDDALALSLLGETGGASARLARGRSLARLGRLSQAERAFAREAAAGEPSAAAWRGVCRLLRGDAGGALDLEVAERGAGGDSSLLAALGACGRRSALERACELSPGNFLHRALRAEALLREGRQEEAAREAAAAAKLEPRSAWVLALCGCCARAGGSMAEAEDFWKRAALLDPSAVAVFRLRPESRAAEALVQKGQAAFDAVDYGGAAAAFEEAREREPRSAVALAYLGRHRRFQGRGAESRALLERACSLAPGCGWIAAWHGLALQGSRPRRALEEFDRAAAAAPFYSGARAWRGALRRRLGDLPGALSDLDAAIELSGELDSGRAAAHHERRLAQWSLGLESSALDDAEAAWRLNPKNGWAETRDRARALRAAEELRARAAAPGSDPRLREWLGLAALESGAPASALPGLKTAARAKPRDPRLRAWLGRALAETGRMKEAARELTLALSLSPRLSWARSWRGAVHLNLNRPEEALADLDAALAQDPAVARVHAWRGLALSRLGRNEEACTALGTALDMDPGFALARWLRARLLLASLESRLGPLELEVTLDARSRLGAAELWRGLVAHGYAYLAQGSARSLADFRRVGRRSAAESDWSAGFSRDAALEALSREFQEAVSFRPAAPRPGDPLEAAFAAEGARPLLDAGRLARLAWGPEAALPWLERAADAGAGRAWLGESLWSSGRKAAALAAWRRARGESWARAWRADAEGREGAYRSVAGPAGVGLRALESGPRLWTREDMPYWTFRERALRRVEAAARKSPDCAWLQRVAGLAHYLRRDFASSAERFAAAGAADGRSGWDQILEADALFFGGDAPRAAALFEACAARLPAFAWAHALLGRLRYVTHHPGMLVSMDAACALAPRLGWAEAWRAESLAKLGRAAAARRAFSRARRLDPSYDRARSWGGMFALRQGLRQRARAELDAAVRLNPMYEVSLFARSAARLQSGDAAGARRDLLAAAGVTAAAAWELGWVDLGQPDAAVERSLTLLDGLLARFPEDPLLRRWRGQTLTALGRDAQAAADLAAAACLLPSDPWVHAWLGRSLARSGREDEAERALTRAARLPRPCAWAWAERGRLRLGQGRLSEALADLDRAVELSRRSEKLDAAARFPEARAWRAEALILSGRLSEARADLLACCRLRPQWKWAFAWLGLAEAGRGDAEAALRAFAQAEEKGLDLPGPLSAALALRGDAEAAKELAASELSRRPASRAAAALAGLLAAGEAPPPGLLEALFRERLAHDEFPSTPRPRRAGRRDEKRLAALSRRAAADPWDGRSRREKGELLAGLGRFAEALRALDEAAPLSRADARLHHLAGRLRLAAGDARGALSDAAKMREIDPLSVPARLLRADAWSALGRPGQAAAELRAADAIFPGEPRVRERLAALHAGEKEREELAAAARRAARSGRLSEAVSLYARFAGFSASLPGPLELPASPRQDLSYTLAWSGTLPAAAARRARLALLRAASRRPFEPELLLLLGALELHLELPSAVARLSLAAWLAGDWPEGWIWRHAARVQQWRRSKRWSGLAELGLSDLERAMTRSNGDCRPYLLRAEVLADHESKEAALRDLEKALKLDPDNSWALAERSELRCDRGDLSGAMTDLRRLSRRHHGAAWTAALRARLWANSNRPALALKEIARVLRREPKNGVVWAWRAEMERRYGLLREAGRHFARARALDPGYTLGRAWRARWLLQTGRAALAARELAEVARRDPRHLLVHAWLGEALLRLGRHREAAAAFENAEPLDPRTAWNGPVRRGQKLRESSRRAAFEEALDEAVRARPRSAWAHFLRGRFLADSPRRREGLESLSRALALAPGHSRALGWRGEARRRDGDAEGALADLTAALAADPGWAWARSWRALALQALGRGEEALAEAAEAARRLPQSSGARRVYGQVLCLSGRHEAARRELERAILLDGKDAEARLWLASAQRLSRRGAAA